MVVCACGASILHSCIGLAAVRIHLAFMLPLILDVLASYEFRKGWYLALLFAQLRVCLDLQSPIQFISFVGSFTSNNSSSGPRID